MAISAMWLSSPSILTPPPIASDPSIFVPIKSSPQNQEVSGPSSSRAFVPYAFSTRRPCIDPGWWNTSRFQETQKAPIVLSRDEVRALIQAPHHLKHRVILATFYTTGLRVSELCRLQGTDIDSGRMVIIVRQGKGKKDRQVGLSPDLLPLLRRYWKLYGLQSWLFPGHRVSEPITRGGVEFICQKARPRSPRSKRPSIRIYCATPLRPICSKPGMDLRSIQLLLGHATLRSTSLYLHVANPALQTTTESPEHVGHPARSGSAAMNRPQIEVADIIRQHGEAFLARYGHTLNGGAASSPAGHRAVSHRCPWWPPNPMRPVWPQEQAYNSCRNRHCPKCHGATQAAWLQGSTG